MSNTLLNIRQHPLIQWISHLGPRFWKAVGAVLIVLLIILIFPFKIMVVPEWQLRVVDENGAPVRAIKVTEHWQHYLFESDAHEELLQTGNDGIVKFPERTIRASLLRKLVATLDRLDETGVKAKKDPSASVVVWGSKLHETAVAVYHLEQSPQPEIVAHTTP